MSLKLNSSGGGSVTLQEPVTASDLTVNLPTTSGTMVLDGGSPTFGTVTSTALTVNGNNISAVNSMGFRNRIINGDMRIDQRNAGASVTPTTSGTYTLDRWRADLSQASKYSVQQNAGSVTPPAGFSNYLGATSLSAYTVGATEQFTLRHFIEGFNSADLGWGASGAQSVTLSFWVRSSLTGTFGGTLVNSAQDRCYGFSYTVSAANTWEQKTIVVAGDTTGTWLTNNGIGIAVRFSLGSGSSSLGAAGSWGSSAFTGVTGQVNMVSTNGATFYITGVQLEAGTVATPFERRDIGRELIMCQRYYQTRTGLVVQAYASTSFFAVSDFAFLVTMRAAPTVTLTNGTTNNLSSASTTTPSPSGFGLALGPISTGLCAWGSSASAAYTAAIEL